MNTSEMSNLIEQFKREDAINERAGQEVVRLKKEDSEQYYQVKAIHEDTQLGYMIACINYQRQSDMLRGTQK